MKILASLLLTSATLLGTGAYAQEPPDVLRYQPVVGQIRAVTRVQVVREIEAVKTGGRVGFNEVGQPVAEVAGDEVALEVIRVEAVTVDLIGVYAPNDESYTTASGTDGEVAFGRSEEPATELAADNMTDEPMIAEGSAVDVIGLYPSGDQSYKAAFSVTATSRG